MRERDHESERKMKTYADNKNRAQKSNIGVGHHVLVKTKRKNKLSTPFWPVPYEVVKQNGPCVTVKRGNHEITRNSSFFKKVEEGAQSSGPKDDPDVDVADDADDVPADDAPVDTTRNRGDSSWSACEDSISSETFRRLCLQSVTCFEMQCVLLTESKSQCVYFKY
jgi:hypothetical protein